MHDLFAIVIGLASGTAMSVAVSGVWVVLQVPARLQERFRVSTSWPMTWALVAGLIFSAAHDALGLSVAAPHWIGAVGIALSGVFVGMLASALGEILQVVPVLRQRLHLENVPMGYRLALIAGKAIGAVVATLVITM